MAVNEIQGSLVLTEISEDNNTWKTLVCEQGASFDITTSVTTEKTKCGSIKGVDEPDWKMSGDAVVNAKPSGTEWSYADLVRWAKAKQKTYIRRMSPVDANLSLALGQAFYQGGEGYFTSVTGDTGNGGVVKVSWTFEGQGELITTKFAITTQPVTPQAVAVAATLTVSVVVVGGDQPLAYQWKRNGTNVSGGTGGTTATYTKTNAQAVADSGTYTCVITDEGGAVLTSTGSVVTVS